MAKRRYNKKRKTDLLDQSVSAGFTRDDKLTLLAIKEELGTSYAALLREAVHEHYREYFKRGTYGTNG